MPIEKQREQEGEDKRPTLSPLALAAWSYLRLLIVLCITAPLLGLLARLTWEAFLWGWELVA